jgi:phenylpyruvate tautomerase PptA (4-oxalocrotonate tautomerase family)
MILKEQPSKTPSADIRSIEQISAELISHMKAELIDHLSETLQKQFGIEPKQQIYIQNTVSICL